MNYKIKSPDFFQANIQLPSSKSLSNRALVLNALSKSPHPVENLSDCDDTRVILPAFTADSKEIDVRAAGTAMRFLTAYFAQTEGEHILTGTERMKKRPIRILVDALCSLGAEIEYLGQPGFPPLKITGKQLNGGTIRMDGSVSSQFISALMMIAPGMKQGLIIEFDQAPISQPYLQMTRRLMEQFGVIVSWDECRIRIEPQAYKPVPYTVESDWSAASYWYELLALAPLGSRVELSGLHADSLQGDSAVARLFQPLGVSTEFTETGIRLHQTEPSIDRMEYNFVNEPDLAQTLALTCVLKNIPFRFTGLQSLKIKETDRIQALQCELHKLGYVVRSENDSILEWTGEKVPAQPQPAIDTYEDHRMAMAFSPASWLFDEIRINDPAVVSKSYPAFWNDLIKSGFQL